MYFIPGFLISIVTFPGVMVHEVAHQLFCRILRVAVLDVCYFRFGNPAGYVIHEIPKKSFQHLLIGIGPFFINSILGAIIALPSAIPVVKLGTGSFIDYFLIWLGISIAMHSFPSTGDAKSIWTTVRSPKTPLLTRLIAVPVVGIIYLFAMGSFFWLDLIYGIAVVTLLPNIFIALFV